MIKKISTEAISAIKDGAVVTLGANAEINMNGKYNIHKLYDIINTIFAEMDNNRTFEFGDYTIGLAETEDDAMWFENGIYVIPTNAKEEDGEWDYSSATFYTLEPYFSDLLRGDIDIIDNMANTIFGDLFVNN